MEKLTIEKAKEIIDEVLAEEKEKIDFSFNFVYTTHSDFFKNNIRDKKKPILVRTFWSLYFSLPMISGNAFLKKHEIVVFKRDNGYSPYVMNESKKNNVPIDEAANYRDYFDLIHSVYHELRHTMQQSYDDMSFNGFFCNIEHFLLYFIDYNLEHDKYFHEIDANWYGINMTFMYLKKHFPDDFPSILNIIKSIYNSYFYNYVSFNPSERIENLILKLKSYSFSNSNFEYFKKIKPILEIFLDDCFNFKSLNEIMSNSKFNDLDKRISYGFLSCQSFLKNIDFDSLSKNELLFLQDAVSFSLNSVSFSNTVFFEDRKIKKGDKLFLMQLLLNSLISFVPFSHFSKLSRYQNQEVKRYSEIIESQVKKRKLNRGYITISLCYFLGLIISICTIVYFILK